MNRLIGGKMKKYFYSNGKEKQGPFSFEELKNKDIKKETLIWFQGLEDWVPAKEIKEFDEILELIPPPIIKENFENDLEFNNTYDISEKGISNQSDAQKIRKTLLEDTPHPWLRFFARFIDVFFGGTIIVIVFSYAVGYFFPRNVTGYLELAEHPIIFGFATYLLWLPIEALLISTTSTTFAKWVFGINVLSKTGDKLDFKASMKRVFLVFLKGEALGIPIIIFFTRIAAYKHLNKLRTTLWDNSVGSVVTHKELGVLRKFACVFLTIITLILFSVMNAM
jgi:uncharacterized RDD family membrane protein YckC